MRRPFFKIVHPLCLRLKGGALYFAIFFSFITAMLSGFFLLIVYYNRLYINEFVKQQQIVANVKSGLTLCMNESASFPQEEASQVDLYDEGQPVIEVSQRAWGAYRIFTSKSLDESYPAEETVLAGALITGPDRIGLYMADEGRYLSVSGNSYISGDCYLPSLGVRRAYIEGQAYNRKDIIDGTSQNSESILPPLQDWLFKKNYAYFKGECDKNDSLVPFDHVSLEDTVSVSFSEKTLLLFSKSDIVIDNVYLRGNIRIVSARSILVTPNAGIDNAILYAPGIYIAPGFTGSLQAFARDTLLVGGHVKLFFPSVLALVDSTAGNKSVHLMEGSATEGIVFLDVLAATKANAILTIGHSASVNGQVWWPGVVEHKGTVTGCLYCKGFTLVTASAHYDDHLLNAVVDGKGLSSFFLGIGIRNKEPLYRIIKQLD